MTNKLTNEARDDGRPAVFRAVIYLSGPTRDRFDKPLEGSSLDDQRLLCRWTAAALGLNVIAEFTDERMDGLSRAALHRAVLLAEDQRLAYFIIASWRNLLVSHVEQAYEAVRRLDHAGVTVISADSWPHTPLPGLPRRP